ncbi:FAD-binding domain-containing protein [Xylariaceae sp. FL1272]|nr:FAD-binding domain-containing protein [Xylariaceae sp. FL1272]
MASIKRLSLISGLLFARSIWALLSDDLIEIARVDFASQSLIDNITKSSKLINDAVNSLANVTASVNVQGAASACEIATLVLQSSQVYQNQNTAAEQYTEEKAINWSETCWLAANCFVRPRNAVEAALLMSIVKTTGAKFAVRSGGHNPNPGFASVGSDGVLIDLQDLKYLSIDAIDTLSAGPGHRWIDLYDFSDERNRTVKGGRTADVGIPGFLLGGGMPYFPSLQGLGADSIINYELILPNSTMISANAHENSEIFDALKGGGANFGIVTRFDIETYPLIHAQYEVNLYNVSDYINIFAATIKLQRAMELDPKIDAYVTVTPEFVVVGMFYADWLSERPSAFDGFYQLDSLVGSMVPLTNGTVTSLAADLAAHTPSYNARRFTAAITTLVESQLYVEFQKHFLQVLEITESKFAANLSYTIQPVSSAMVREGNARRGNTLGLTEVAQTWWSVVVEWADEADDAAAHTTLNGLLDALDTMAQDKYLLMEFRFMNDANLDQDVLGSYGTTNLDRISAAAHAADPEGLQQTLQNDGFLLRNT